MSPARALHPSLPSPPPHHLRLSVFASTKTSISDGDCAGLTGLSEVSQGVRAAQKVCGAVSPIHVDAQPSPRHTLLQTVTWSSCWLAALGLADDSIRFSPSLPGGPLEMSSPRRGLSSVEEKGSQALGMVFQMLSQVPPCAVLKGTPPHSCTFPKVDPINAADVVTTPFSLPVPPP